MRVRDEIRVLMGEFNREHGGVRKGAV